MHCLCVWRRSPLLSAACHSTAEENKMENQLGFGLYSYPCLWVRPQGDVNWWRPTELTPFCWLMPVKDPTCLLISCLCLTWWIVPVLTVNKRCIYVNERESMFSSVMPDWSSFRKDCFLHKKYQLTDRQMSCLFWNIWASVKRKTTKTLFFFFFTTNTNIIKTEFPFGDKVVFSGSAGKHSAWRRSYIPKGFSVVGFSLQMCQFI